MTGMVDRRNDPVFWGGVIVWRRLKLKTLPKCSDCWLNIHHRAPGVHEGWMPRARWRRLNTVQTPDGSDTVTVELCDEHRQEWLDWTPGQMVMPS